jgi:hypothetical protein
MSSTEYTDLYNPKIFSYPVRDPVSSSKVSYTIASALPDSSAHATPNSISANIYIGMFVDIPPIRLAKPKATGVRASTPLRLYRSANTPRGVSNIRVAIVEIAAA